jgi:hypothetical protein
MAIDEMPFGGGVSVSNLGLRIDVGDLGRVYMRANNLGVDMPASGPGYLRMPADGPLPEQWFCFDDDSSYGTLGEGSYFANLTGLRGLGTCPGEPVSGTVSVCFGADSCGGERTFTSEVEGATFTTPLGGTRSVGGPIGGSEVDVERDLGDADGGVLYLHATEIDPESTGPQQSAVDVVYFIVPLGEPDGGAIYCAELDATLEYEMERGVPDPLSAEIANISRLGTCGDRPGDGYVDLCMNFGP